MLSKLKLIGLILFGLYICFIVILYFLQEKLLFHPVKIDKDKVLQFEIPFEEIELKAEDQKMLHGVLFKSDEGKGVILFLHGNGGAVDGWGQRAHLYTEVGFDVFFLDYRGYGKSEGAISNENQMIRDAQLAYDYLKQDYTENQISVSGTSLGTGIATQIASKNHPKQLFLISPYYTLESLILEKIKMIPPVIIKYKFKTASYLSNVACPIHIFHGDQDKVIPIHHGIKLKKEYQKIEY